MSSIWIIYFCGNGTWELRVAFTFEKLFHLCSSVLWPTRQAIVAEITNVLSYKTKPTSGRSRKTEKKEKIPDGRTTNMKKKKKTGNKLQQEQRNITMYIEVKIYSGKKLQGRRNNITNQWDYRKTKRADKRTTSALDLGPPKWTRRGPRQIFLQCQWK